MQTLIIWFEEFVNQLPPLLQLILGMLLAVGVFKLLVVGSDAYDAWKKKKPEERSTSAGSWSKL